MDSFPVHQVRELSTPDQKLTIFEYKKELSVEDNSKLSQFLSKVELGMKDEGGLDGIISICKDWRTEIEIKKQ